MKFSIKGVTKDDLNNALKIKDTVINTDDLNQLKQLIHNDVIDYRLYKTEEVKPEFIKSGISPLFLDSKAFNLKGIDSEDVEYILKGLHNGELEYTEEGEDSEEVIEELSIKTETQGYDELSERFLTNNNVFNEDEWAEDEWAEDEWSEEEEDIEYEDDVEENDDEEIEYEDEVEEDVLEYDDDEEEVEDEVEIEYEDDLEEDIEEEIEDFDIEEDVEVEDIEIKDIDDEEFDKNYNVETSSNLKDKNSIDSSINDKKIELKESVFSNSTIVSRSKDSAFKEPISLDFDSEDDSTVMDFINNIGSDEKSSKQVSDTSNGSVKENNEDEIKRNLPPTVLEYLKIHKKGIEVELRELYSKDDIDKYVNRGLINKSRGKLFI